MTDAVKDLGVPASSNLTWSLNVSIVVAKAKRMLRFLRSHCASHGFGPDRKRLLYLTFVRAHLAYASEVWAAQSCISDLKIIECVLRRVTRYILNCSFYVIRRPSYTSRHSILKSLRLSYWFECHDLIFFLKCMKSERLV